MEPDICYNSALSDLYLDCITVMRTIVSQLLYNCN